MREACWYRRLISHMVPIALVGVLVAHGFLALLPMRGELPVRIRLGVPYGPGGSQQRSHPVSPIWLRHLFFGADLQSCWHSLLVVGFDSRGLL